MRENEEPLNRVEQIIEGLKKADPYYEAVHDLSQSLGKYIKFNNMINEKPNEVLKYEQIKKPENAFDFLRMLNKIKSVSLNIQELRHVYLLQNGQEIHIRCCDYKNFLDTIVRTPKLMDYFIEMYDSLEQDLKIRQIQQTDN